MTYTNFPQGITSFGLPVIGSGQLPVTQGNYWFVSSTTGSAGGTGSLDAPYALTSQAIGAASANDVIILLASHAETVIAAGTVTVNKTGLTIFGCGNGNARPTFTFTTAVSASFLISSAGTKVQNIIGIAGINALTQPFDVRAAGCTLNIEWQDPSDVVEAARAVLGNASADRLCVNLKYIGRAGGTSCVNAVRLVGSDNAIINADFYGKASTGWVEFLTTASTNVEVYGYMYNSGTTNFSRDVVDTVTGSTWFASIYDGAFGGNVSGGSAAALASDDVSSVVALQEAVAFKSAAVMTNGQTMFTVAGAPIQIVALVSVCVTSNGATASTLQYSATPTVGTAQTLSGASASLANAAAGGTVTLAGTALATAALFNANGPNLIANPMTIIVPVGTITMVIGTGSTTGTWSHYLRYKPMASGVTVS